MRSTFIFFLLALGCSSKFKTLFEAREAALNSRVIEAEKLYNTFLSGFKDKGTDEYAYYKLELCDLFINTLNFEKAKTCLSDLTFNKDAKHLVSPRIQNLVLMIAKSKGKLEAIELLKEFLTYDEEYLEGVYDYLVKNF